MSLKPDLFMMALAFLKDTYLTEENLDQIIAKLKLLESTASIEELNNVRNKLESQIGVRAFKGIGIRENDQSPWLDQRKLENKSWDYWNAYKTWLRLGGFSSDVIRVLDEDTDAILGECGDPLKEGPWGIKGLVMGDVQSGKTASYSGLINKAADTGYKVIILLTGTIEELRAQTQARLDEGFAGQDSRKWFQKQESVIGVGTLKKRRPAVLTSVDKDFLSANLEAFNGVPLDTLVAQEPVLLVLKKNKSVLSSLLTYLKSHIKAGQKDVDYPMLLIDDEADNASVNVRTEDSPATINKLIGEIRIIFRKSTYCAYTATPFANVFIDPESDRDIFPENFVYTLHSPTSYVGAASIFLEDGKHNNHLVSIDDAELLFPEKHKKDLHVGDIPESLREAIRCFCLATCIRDHRNEILKHRSMLINVSRFTDVQAKLAKVVANYMYELKEEVNQYILVDNIWEKHEHLVQLHKTFNIHYGNSGIIWDQVRKELANSISSIKTVTINQKSEEKDRLNYQHYKNTILGRRVIAIGGLTLSRGLTLEGLSTSYFYRNSKAYDTLLQMGRWFGYRPGYVDLCRIWMTDEVQDWYSHLSEVVDELRQDIKSMHSNNRKPRDFGMRVMSHPGTLLVTARNKMKTSKEVVLRLSFSNTSAETPYILKSIDSQRQNLSKTISFINSLGVPTEHKGRRIWRCSKDKISTYLSSLAISSFNSFFIPSSDNEEHPLMKFIRDSKSTKMQEWDIALPQGGESPLDQLKFLDKDAVLQSFKPRGRQFERVSSAANYLKINRGRVGEIEDDTIGIDSDLIEEIRNKWLNDRVNTGKKSVPGKVFREKRDRPLLTISLIVPLAHRNTVEDVGSENHIRKIRRPTMDPSDIGTSPLVALGLSFPNLDDLGEGSIPEVVTYRLNKVALQELGLLDEEEEEDEDAID